MSNRWLILVAILVLLGILLLGSGGEDRGSPPSRLPGQPEAPDEPSPPGVPPTVPDPDAAVAADAEPTPEAQTGERENAPADRLCIAGRVVTADRGQGAKAYIQAVPVDEFSNDEIYELEVQTDDEGRFRIDGLAPGRYRLLVDPAREESGGPPEPDPVVFAGDEDVEIALEPRAILTVKIVAAPGGPERTPSTITTYRLLDDAGKRVSSCVFQGLCENGMKHAVSPGRAYRVEASCGGYRQVGPGEVFIPPGTSKLEFIVRLEPEPEADRAKITFRIRDDLGNAVNHLTIQRRVDPSVTMGDSYDLEGGEAELTISAGRWTFFFDRAHDAKAFEEPYLRSRVEVELRPGEQLIRDVTLNRGGWVRFHPLEGRTWKIHCAREGEEPKPVRTTPSPDGVWLLPRPLKPWRPGTYIAFVARGDDRSQRTAFVIRAGKATNVLWKPEGPR